jgi:predicted glutamine amidotransferase
MCRYIAYLGTPLRLEDLVYRPANSLVHQASDAMESPTRINADGFGVGWYNPEIHDEPAVFKDMTPAWSNANLRSMAGKVASSCVLAHVRAARRFDPVSQANCHPFQHHRLLWMHNGDIPGRGRLHRRVLERTSDFLAARIRGNTDTELAFTLFLTYLNTPLDRGFESAEITEALERTISQLAAWHHQDEDDRPLILNFCVTDGQSFAATRYGRGEVDVPSLHYATGSRYVCEEGLCRMEIRREDDPGCVILASERLSEGIGWATVEPNRLVVVQRDLTVTERPLSI